MGKRSQAKQRWLRPAQRVAHGEAQSGARLWYFKDGAPKPTRTSPLPRRDPETVRGVRVHPQPEGTNPHEQE